MTKLAMIPPAMAQFKDAFGVRAALRKPAVLAATGWSNSTLYKKIQEGKFPAPCRIDPEGRASIWWADEIAAFQQRATAAQ